MHLLLAAVVWLVPLLILPGISFYYDITPKLVILLIGTALAAFFVRPADLWRRPDGRRFTVLLFAAFAILVISTAVSSDRTLSWTGTDWRRFGLVTETAVLLFAFLVACEAGEHSMLFLRAITLAGIPAALYGVVQYFGWDPLIPPAAYHVGEGVWSIVRPPGTLGHAGYFANWLLYPVFAGIAVTLQDRSRPWRAAGISATALGSLAIVLSGTRSALLGLTIGVVALVLMSRKSVTRRTVFAAAMLAILLAAFVLSPAGERLRGRIHWSAEDTHGGARPLLWRDSLRMAARHPILGTGPETFSIEFPQIESAQLARAYPDFFHESPHNLFLDPLTAQGLPRLAILVLLAWFGLGSARSHPALFAALVAALVSEQFTSFIMPTALYFYVLLALIFGTAPPDSDRGASGGRLLRFVLLPAAAYFVVFAVQLLVSDHAVAEAKKAFAARNPARAMERYRFARRWFPPGMSADLWYSRAAESSVAAGADLSTRIQLFQEGLSAAVRASRASEQRANTEFNLAQFYARRNDLAHLEESLRRAELASPQWYKPHWMLARMLARTGRREEAAREATLAVDLSGANSKEVAGVWKEIDNPR